MAEGNGGFAVLKLAGKKVDLECDVLAEQFPMVVLALRPASSQIAIASGEQAALVENVAGQIIARQGTVGTIDSGRITLVIENGASQSKGPKLTDCQLPAMIRPKTRDGHYGGWRGAAIVKHSPNRLHLVVEEGHVVPSESELMFSPIGSEHSGGPRLYGEEGAVVNASDVRCRRIRVRAVTRDVLASTLPGTVTLVVDISRSLYRAA
jgi:hypothetical protein